MSKKTKILFIILFLTFSLFLFTHTVFAQEGVPKIENPLGGEFDPRVILGRIIGAALGVVGSIALVVFILGGLMWMTAGGNEERIRKGKDIIVWATLGLAVIFASYALVKFLLAAFSESGNKAGEFKNPGGGAEVKNPGG